MSTAAKLQRLIEDIAELPSNSRAELMQALIEMDPRYADLQLTDELERTPLTDIAS